MLLIACPFFLLCVFTLGFEVVGLDDFAEVKFPTDESRFPLWAFFLVLGLVISASIMLLTNPETIPHYYLVVVFFSLVGAMCWLNLVADYLVDVVQSIGLTESARRSWV